MLSTFLLTALLSTPAVAKDRPSVAVVGLHDQSLELEDQREAVESVRSALSDRKRFDVLDPTAVARAIAGREELILSETYLAAGRRVLEDGRLLHDQAQPEQAIPALEEAVSSLIETMPKTDASRELWEAYLYLGASHQEIGQEKAAAEVWAKAVAINPERQPDAARIPPTVVQGYEQAKRAAVRRTGGLSVKVEGQADVLINGRSVGPAPVKIDDLPVGQVHVRVRGPGGAFAYQAVDIMPGVTATAELALGPVSLPAAGDSGFARTRATTGLYRTLGQQLDADLILVAGGDGDQAIVQLYAPAADVFSNALKLPSEGDSVDEVVRAIPELVAIVSDEGGIPSIASTATAGPLDPSHNRLLADLLLDPKPLAPAAPTRGGRRTGALVAGGVGALVVGGAVGGFLLATSGDGNRGTIIVGPVP